MGRTYLVSSGGKNDGPFTKQELTGKFLRGEIEKTTQLCAVGGSTWHSMSDLLRESARRKSFSACAIGIIALMFAFWLGLSYRFDASRRSFAMQVDLIILLKKNAKKDEALNEYKAAISGRNMNSEEKAESEQAEAKIAKLTAEVEDFERKKWAKGAGALCALGMGIGLLVVASRTKPPERPPRPPAPQANKSSKPPFPPPVAMSATAKEPKAVCPACQQKVAFPVEMTGRQVSCPTCGAMMTLDDCSETLA